MRNIGLVMVKTVFVVARHSYFTLLFSWLFALDGFDLPMRLPVGFFLLLVHLGRLLLLVPLMVYNRFSANLITFSTCASGSSFKIANTTFCEAACGKPSMVSAETASS